MTQSNFGTGIGLHLSRSLVELHHGIIKAENREDGQGTRFVIRLPLGSNHLKAEELENPEETFEYLFYFVFVNTDSVIGDIYLEIIFQSTPVGIVVTGFQ